MTRAFVERNGDRSMHSRKFALTMAKIYRLCPPSHVVCDSSSRDMWRAHRSRCPYCAVEDKEGRGAWERMVERFGAVFPSADVIENGDAPRVGQLRYVTKSLGSWRDGFYYNPPLVLVLDVPLAVSDDVLVAQTYHDIALAGPGDLIVEDPLHPGGMMFVESWHTYTVGARFPGALRWAAERK